jgi:hypothetical protein
MPGDPKECRENAKRCFEFAQTARTEADRERFEGLAQRWLALATDFEAASLLLGKWSSGSMRIIRLRQRAIRQVTGNARCTAKATSLLKMPHAQAIRQPERRRSSSRSGHRGI